MTTIGMTELAAAAGSEVGVSDWMAIDQARIDAFAEATGDHQWIHVDRERARREGPWGTTIAHGFLTLSLVSTLMRNTVAVHGVRMSINYGLNRVRFVSPVPSGARIRARVRLANVTAAAEAVQATWEITVEREGGDRPALVAEWIVRYYGLGRAGAEGTDGGRGTEVAEGRGGG